MSVGVGIGVLACLAQLALALLAVQRSARAPLALPLALLCLDVFAWNGAALATAISGWIGWNLIDHLLSPLTAPLALDFALRFMGRQRASRRTAIAAYALTGVFSAATAALFLIPGQSGWVRSKAWGFGLLAVALPIMLIAIAGLIRHHARSADPQERARTRLLILSFAVATLLGSTEELNVLDPRVPEFGSLGMFLATVPLAVLALRFRLFERDISIRVLSYVLALAACTLVVFIAAFHGLDARTASLVTGASTLSLLGLALGRRMLAREALEKRRLAELAALGRFAAQMSHDLRNPLAAMRGAAQVIQGDLAAPSGAVDSRELIALLLEQADRMARILETYSRAARVEPALAPTDLNQLVERVVAAQAPAISSAIRVRTELAEGLPRCPADPDLLASVLENLMSNACEAMEAGGELTVRTGRTLASEPAGVTVVVEDTGGGMDPRTLERAFDDFYSTKASGSGLGLAFARRVVEAHGGNLALSSQQGLGTRARIRLPLA